MVGPPPHPLPPVLSTPLPSLKAVENTETLLSVLVEDRAAQAVCLRVLHVPLYGQVDTDTDTATRIPCSYDTSLLIRYRWWILQTASLWLVQATS